MEESFTSGLLLVKSKQGLMDIKEGREGGFEVSVLESSFLLPSQSFASYR